MVKEDEMHSNQPSRVRCRMKNMGWFLAQQTVKMCGALPRDVWKLKGLIVLFSNTSSGGDGTNDWGKNSIEL